MVFNILSSAQLQWRTPYEALTGSTPDISAFLEFGFWDLVYYRLDDHGFPSESDECLAHVVRITPNVGDALTYILLDCETNKKLYWSTIHPASILSEKNQGLAHVDGEISGHLPTSDKGPPPVVKSQANTPGFSTSLKSFDPTQIQEMLG